MYIVGRNPGASGPLGPFSLPLNSAPPGADSSQQRRLFEAADLHWSIGRQSLPENAASLVSSPEPQQCHRTALTVEALARSFLDNLFFVQGRSLERATVNDLYMALAHTVRDRLVERWTSTVANYQAQDVRVVCYLSAEFLTGPHLANNLINLGIYDEAEQAMRQLGLDLNILIEQEEEPGLGNGGLGRLASCFMDSLATLDIPAIGYGIRYEYGIFDQQIRDGWQVEIDGQVAPAWKSLGAGAAGRCIRGENRRPHRNPVRCKRPRARDLDSAEGGARYSPRHAHPRLSHQHRQHHAPVVGTGRRVLRLRYLQYRRLFRRGRRQSVVGKHLQNPLSQRRRLAGQATAARAAVLLRLLLAAAHPAESSSRRSGRWPSCIATSPSR